MPCLRERDVVIDEKVGSFAAATSVKAYTLDFGSEQ